MTDMDRVLPLMKEGGAVLSRLFRQPIGVRYKGPRDLVTEADVTVEKLFRERLAALFPGVPFIGEESGLTERLDSCFILDPLDGTTNFAHGYPAFCISLARIDGGEPAWGFVYDPVHDELFSAQKGAGAFLNGAAMRVSAAPVLNQALLATGFPYADDTVCRSLNYFNHILPHCQGIRRGGSAALDLCYTACGRFDGFFELNLKPWDVAAGILIVREAGGRATDLAGAPSTPYDGNIVASNGIVHDELLAQVRRADGQYAAFEPIFRKAVFGKD